MSQSEHLTLVEAWLARPRTQAEVKAARDHFKRYLPVNGGTVRDEITDFQATIFALAVDILCSIEMFGGDGPDPEEPVLGGFDPAEEDDEDDDEEPWRRR